MKALYIQKFTTFWGLNILTCLLGLNDKSNHPHSKNMFNPHASKASREVALCTQSSLYITPYTTQYLHTCCVS